MSEQNKDAGRADFEREDRYLVIKYSDLNKVSPEYRLPFKEYLDDILAEVPHRECVVVESDWPEYEKVWQMIEARMTGASLPVGVPDVLFDGFAVLSALSVKAKSRTSSENVSDVLDAVVKLIRDEALAAPAVKAEQVQCEVCHGQGEVYSGRDQHFHYFDFQPPEPIMDVCPECGGEEAPSLPAAGSAGEEVEVVGFILRPEGYGPYTSMQRPSNFDGAIDPLMTVAQCQRMLDQQRAALSAQQSAPERVSVPVELSSISDRLARLLETVRGCERLASEYSGSLDGVDEHGVDNHDDPICAEFHRLYYAMFDGDKLLSELRSLLASHGRGEA